MSDFVISTDACYDLPDYFMERYEIPVVPMPYSLNIPEGDGLLDKIKKDYKRVDYRSDTSGFLGNMKGFFDTLRKGAVPITSQANAHDTAAVLEPILKAGNDVLHISFSSGMSGSYNSACIAVAELAEKYPDRKIYAVDSLSGAAGLGLCVIDAVKCREDGKTIEETRDYINGYKTRYHHYFTVGDNGFIARSGRISSFQYMFTALLNITIILGIDGEGRVYPAAKVRGKKNVYKKFLELLEENKDGDSVNEIILSHGDNPVEIKLLGSMITEALPEVKKIDYTFVNQLVGCNSGPDSLALFFRGKPRTAHKK